MVFLFILLSLCLNILKKLLLLLLLLFFLDLPLSLQHLHLLDVIQLFESRPSDFREVEAFDQLEVEILSAVLIL